MKNRLVEKYPFAEKKINVIPNGVDTKLFHPQKRVDVRQRLGLKKDKFIVFFSGNIWKVKGFDLVVEVANELKKTRAGIDFIIAGGFYPEIDPLHKEWKNISPSNMDYVGLLPHRKLADYYAAADIAIAPSIWEEPFGMVIIEAMACGTPVIASKIGGIPEIIRDGESGLLIKPGCAEELREKILWCMKNPNALSVMASNARNRSLCYDWKNIAVKMELLYKKIMYD
jgi:glycosyltransferase involved in cell wall biosynthesis